MEERKERKYDPNPRWYVIHTYSGYENKVAKDIETIVGLRNLRDQIMEVRIPMEKTTETKDDGRVVEVEHKLFPSYVLVHMIVNDEMWILLRNIRGVTGFVGPEGNPIPLTDEELVRLHIGAQFESEEGVVRAEAKAPFKTGDSVKVVSGPMQGFTGVVDDVDLAAGKTTVMVSMGGRDIPTELDIKQVELL